MSVNVFSKWHLWLKAGVGLTLSLLSGLVSAQDTEVKVNGGFLSDSLKIGDQTAYYLTAHYPSDLNILFPDTAHAFTPFEYQKKEFFPTQTTDGISTDSAVYFLTTFEIDRIQQLSLPVYLVHGKDCTVVSPAADTVLITQFVAEVPDTIPTQALPLKMNTTYQKVFYNFNLVLAAIVLTVLLAIALITWGLFGRKISQYFRARKLRKNHASFLATYSAFVAQLQTTFSPPATELALVTWKKYMEQLESKPYTKLTTRETLRLLKEPALSEHLSRIDKAIYGHNTTVVESLENLKNFADQQFNRKLKEVQHG